MIPPRNELEIARWLLGAGAGAAARRVLGQTRGAEANRLRIRSHRTRLEPRVYALATLSPGDAIVVPLMVRVGESRALDRPFREACDRALGLAKLELETPKLPAVHLDLEEWLLACGASVGLPAALAFIAHFSRPPEIPIIATGELSEDGSVLPVGALTDKLAAGESEGTDQKMMFIPITPGVQAGDAHGVARLREALSKGFGGRSLQVDARLVDFDALLEKSRAELRHDRALELLEAAGARELAPADRARLELERGMRLRHLGLTDDATRAHEAGLALIGNEPERVGAEAAERYQISHWSTRIDEFALEEAVDALTARLNEPFLSLRNELRCRGTLAQALAMQGKNCEALQTREANLPLHDVDSWLASVRPGTYCYLVLDSARDGNARAFDGFAELLVQTTPRADAHQWRYSAMALIRGWVHLERFEQALAWARGQRTFAGVGAPAAIVDLERRQEIPTTHPEVSTKRALLRAARCIGSATEAARHDTSAAPTPSDSVDLVSWIGELAKLEVALALRDIGKTSASDALVEETRRRMRQLHPRADAFWMNEVGDDVAGLEAALDRVWY